VHQITESVLPPAAPGPSASERGRRLGWPKAPLLCARSNESLGMTVVVVQSMRPRRDRRRRRLVASKSQGGQVIDEAPPARQPRARGWRSPEGAPWSCSSSWCRSSRGRPPPAAAPAIASRRRLPSRKGGAWKPSVRPTRRPSRSIGPSGSPTGARSCSGCWPSRTGPSSTPCKTCPGSLPLSAGSSSCSPASSRRRWPTCNA
jgi:hypothetical protein